ncbi:putative branched-subunit amino acid permease [Paenarthrobacter nicotinovorans]|uniref:hypothetical protein n=1 Tax=Paenarthrobacter nicotinovorans TaxID=29320 RepID=UPI00278993CD|nr:hypothetical protein [Paenarthrobacter nicotinovorans]MDP9936846.1 putative branched-subunit amino acid permease [Paenarthrobacter nicotinovorans]
MTTSTPTNTAGRDFALAEFFLGLAAVAHIAVAALAICATTGLDVIPTLIITAAAVAAGIVAYILVLGRK